MSEKNLNASEKQPYLDRKMFHPFMRNEQLKDIQTSALVGMQEPFVCQYYINMLDFPLRQGVTLHMSYPLDSQNPQIQFKVFSLIQYIYFIPLYLLSLIRFSHTQVVNHCSKLVQVIFHCINSLHPRHEELLCEKYFVDKSFVNMPLLKSLPNPLGYHLLFDAHELIVKKTLNEKIQGSSILPLINQKSMSV